MTESPPPDGRVLWYHLLPVPNMRKRPEAGMALEPIHQPEAGTALEPIHQREHGHGHILFSFVT